MMKWFSVLWILCLSTPITEAVILRGGDAETHTTGAGAGAGWDYVGGIYGASGVYLGSYESGFWVLTAAHVGLGNFVLDGVTYAAVAGSGVQIGSADLYLFRLESGPPGLEPLAITSVTPSVGQEVTMIGNGVDREEAETYWTAQWEETANPVLGIYKGYRWKSSARKRWGTNTVSGTGSGEFGIVYQTTFRSTSLSAQATSGDSGGGVFVRSGEQWLLSGLMVAVSSFPGQPGATSIYQAGVLPGNSTVMVDLSFYRGAILAVVVPEAGTGPLLLLAAAGWWLRRHWRSSRAA